MDEHLANSFSGRMNVSKRRGGKIKRSERNRIQTTDRMNTMTPHIEEASMETGEREELQIVGGMKRRGGKMCVSLVHMKEKGI